MWLICVCIILDLFVWKFCVFVDEDWLFNIIFVIELVVVFIFVLGCMVVLVFVIMLLFCVEVEFVEVVFVWFLIILLWVFVVFWEVFVVIFKFCDEGLVGVRVVVCICFIFFSVFFGVFFFEILIDILLLVI